MERSTRQRCSIRAALETADRPLLPQEILALAQRDVPALGLATVYRNLKQLLSAGEIQLVVLPGEPARYEPVRPHHPHFHCMRCKRVFDVHAQPHDMPLMAPDGFLITTHQLTLYGICRDCRLMDPLEAAPDITAPEPPADGWPSPTPATGS